MIRLRMLNVEYVVESREYAEELIAEGFEIVEGGLDDLSVSSEGKSADFVDWNKMTVKELKAYAEENNIDLGSADTKAEIIAAIEGE